MLTTEIQNVQELYARLQAGNIGMERAASSKIGFGARE